MNSRQGAGLLCGISLIVVKIGRNADDRLRDLLPQEPLRILFQLAKHKGGELLGPEFLPAQAKYMVRAHKTLKGSHRGFRMRDQPLLCHGSHADAPVFLHTDCARCQKLTQCIWNQNYTSILAGTSQTVGCSKINSDYCHSASPP